MPKAAVLAATPEGQQELTDSPSPNVTVVPDLDQAVADEVAGYPEPSPVERALTFACWTSYLLSRTGKQRLGMRRSFTDNAVARYLATEAGGEWLVTEQAAMHAETMATYPLPAWLSKVFRRLTAEMGNLSYVNVDDALRDTLDAVAEDVDRLLLLEASPF